MAALRVGLLGYGLAGRVFHAPLVTATAGLELRSVVTADAGRRAQAAAALPEVDVLESAQDLWDRASEHDLVVVATGTATHAQLTLAALSAGLPVVVEKPMAATLADARSMVEAARRSGVPVVPFHNRRWDSDHLTLRRLLDQGVLGRVLRYESRFERWRPSPDPGQWRESLPSETGGGVLLDLGVHLVDQAVQLFGPVVRVYAEVESRRGGADDDVFIALEHAGGERAHLWAGALAAAPGPRLRVLGDAGAFVVRSLDGQEASLRAGVRPDDPGFGVEPPEEWGRVLRGDEGEAVSSERGRWASFYTGVAHLLRGGGPSPVDPADAVDVLTVLEAARRSARQGSVVALRAV